jgi:hypothetical protein
MRILRVLAFLIEIALGLLLIVIDQTGIHVGPLPGPEPLEPLKPLFTVVGAALAFGGLGGLLSASPTPFRQQGPSPFTQQGPSPFAQQGPSPFSDK